METAQITICPTCRGDHAEADCPIVRSFQRIKAKASASGRLRRDPNAIKSPAVSFADKSLPKEP